MLLVIAGIKRDFLHARARVAPKVAPCLLAPQLIFARCQNKTFFGKHHEKRLAVLRTLFKNVI